MNDNPHAAYEACPGCTPNYGTGYTYRPHRDSCPVAIDAREKQRQRDRHEIVKLAFEARLRTDATPMTNREIALWCHSMADAVYPPTTPASVPAVTYLSEAALAAIAAGSSVLT